MTSAYGRLSDIAPGSIDPVDIPTIIAAAKLGRARKDAQDDCCAAFAGALFDVLTASGIKCSLAIARFFVWRGAYSPGWVHSVVMFEGKYYDSEGEFSINKFKISLGSSAYIEHVDDARECLYDDDIHGMYLFFVDKLVLSAKTLKDVLRS